MKRAKKSDFILTLLNELKFLNLFDLKLTIAMQKKLIDFLFSTRLTGVLFVLFAVAMAAGTFIDANQETSPTPLTRTLIYHSFWFKGIMLIFAINFVGNIFKYRLLRKEKWAVLMFHLSFIMIIVGAAITHYFSFEGMMSIREGATQNKFLSAKTYVTTYVDGDYIVDGQAQRRILQNEVDFSHRLNNSFKIIYYKRLAKCFTRPQRVCFPLSS